MSELRQSNGGEKVDMSAYRRSDPMYCPDYEVKGPYRLRKPRPALSIALAFVTMAAILGFIVIPAIYFH